MYVKGEDVFYYLTVYNESYDMPAMPDGRSRRHPEGPLSVPHRRRPRMAKLTVQLLGSGVILNEVLQAQKILAEKSTSAAPSIARRATRCSARLHRVRTLEPAAPRRDAPQATSSRFSARRPDPIIASSDYMRALPEQIANYVGGRLLALGTDGFGRSETRQAFRRFFEVDAESVVVASLYSLVERSKLDRAIVQKAIVDLGIDASKPCRLGLCNEWVWEHGRIRSGMGSGGRPRRGHSN